MASVITTKSVKDQVLIFLLISALLLSRVASAMLHRLALITHIFFHLRIKKQFPEVPICYIKYFIYI